MSGQHIIQQLLAKNNIILDKNDATMIADNNPDKEYSCDKYNKSKGFILLHKLVLISGAKYPKIIEVIKEYILLYPEEVNKVNEKGWSALLLAVSKDVPKVVKLLLSQQSVGVEHNADINIKNNDGRTALIYASYYTTESSLEIVKLLLEHNADIKIKDKNGLNALMYASRFITELSHKVIKLLLEHNADVNIKDEYGWTILMYASRFTTKLSHKVVKLLLEHNADANAKNNYGWTAITFTLIYATKSSSKVAKLLLEYDSVPSNEKLRAAKNIKALNAKN